MGYNNNFLIREYVGDMGSHTNGSLYSSPDLICHSQVEYPQQYFKDNYNEDPNQQADPGSSYNLMYARVKRITGSASDTTGYLHVYQCGSSLFMNPSLWKEHIVKTMQGENCMTFISQVKDQILVGSDVFKLNKTPGKFCLAAIVSDNAQGTIPDDFTSYDQFNYWVRSNPSVALRNLSVMYHYVEKTFERSDSISGVGDHAVLGGFKLVGTNLPEGTKLRMKCEAIDLDKEGVYNPNLPLTDAKMIDPSLNAYVISSAITPDGTWPAGASLDMEFWTESRQGDLCYDYGQSHTRLGFQDHRALRGRMGAAGKLILTGRCQTLFVN